MKQIKTIFLGNKDHGIKQNYARQLTDAAEAFIEHPPVSATHACVTHELTCISRISHARPLACDCEAKVEIWACPKADPDDTVGVCLVKHKYADGSAHPTAPKNPCHMCGVRDW